MFFISKLFSATTVTIKNGQAKCVKGKMMQQTLSSINEVCDIFNITNGEIWVSGDGRIHFSSSIPGKSHQRLRNCVAQSAFQ